MLELPNISVDGDSEDTLKEGASRVVTAVKPDWDVAQLRYKVYTDGITNKLVGVWHASCDRDDQLLVRVYGKKTELFIDRKAERWNIETLQPHGCGPVLHCSFANGLCYSFTPGNPLTTHCVTLPAVYSNTAQHMAKLHSIKCEEETPTPMLFNKMKIFFDLLPLSFSTSDKLKTAVAAGYTKEYLMDECSSLQRVVDNLECPITLCHNDLLLGNIIWHKPSGLVRFIDFEYAAPNYQPFDIGNHFAEFAGVDTVDYSLYPNEEFQKKWLSKYLSCFSPSCTLGLEWWVHAVPVFVLCAHLFWGTWALLQAQHSTIDFDFAGYAMIRLGEYRARKDNFLALGAKAASLR